MVKDVYFVNRMGYYNCKTISESKDIYDVLGYIKINITKKNEKSFRCDYEDILYKEIPKDWYEFNEELLHKFALKRIANILMVDTYYAERARIAFKMLNDKDKKKVCIIIEKMIKEKADKYYKNLIIDTNTRILKKEISYYKKDEDNIIEQYLAKKVD